MGINWEVRLKSKTFWLAIIPAILILIQTVASVFGFDLDLSELSGKLIAVVDAVFVVLAILGIVVDHTTKGIGDSSLAKSYIEPRDDESTSVEWKVKEEQNND